jgi:KDEL-tailed cysteine endopeptidase
MLRIIVLFAVIAMATASFDLLKHSREYYEEKFVDFLKEFQVKAKNGEHFVDMLKKFAHNHDFIESHNASPEGKKFSMKMNQFGHMSFEEWGEYMKFGLGQPARDASSLQHVASNVTALPSDVDWTTKGAVTPVKDQGQCGSCWSFSATGALEGAYEIKYGKLNSFSEQNLVDCDTYDSACNGGLMDNAFKWTQENGGLCYEDDYPYVSGTTGKAGKCDTSCPKDTNVAPKSHTDVTKNSDDALMSALVQQPVSVAIQANQPAFQFYSGGVLTGKCGTRLDHGVLAVGYGTWTDGTDYYKVKNSWSSSWGMDGYILIERGVSQRGGQCGILMGPPSYPNL